MDMEANEWLNLREPASYPQPSVSIRGSNHSHLTTAREAHFFHNAGSASIFM
jgi:hypothetical protein